MTKIKIKVPVRYLPQRLSKKDKKKQLAMLLKSRRLYKKHRYFTRKPVKTYKSKPSNHLQVARKMYGVENIAPTNELAKATGCSLDALNQIVKKGEGAYYSSGSRPNQTAQSWGYARLASSVTGGKAAAVDFSILEKGCNHSKRAYKMALKSRKKYGHGNSKTRKVKVAVLP
jgi:hypothetical protein